LLDLPQKMYRSKSPTSVMTDELHEIAMDEGLDETYYLCPNRNGRITDLCPCPFCLHNGWFDFEYAAWVAEQEELGDEDDEEEVELNTTLEEVELNTTLESMEEEVEEVGVDIEVINALLGVVFEDEEEENDNTA
jgi:hypothetical protein